ncbi:hypothetical protein [Kitasatospora purpeofusca]|uniref:hypothetical protein n=1 Tax=Kitasatospora purpeofusca TaxID=67352 RepID=UPI002E14BDCE
MLLPVLSVIAPLAVAAATPVQAATVTCTVNGTPVTGTTVTGTDGDDTTVNGTDNDDTIDCAAVPSGVVVHGRGGNDTIAVNIGEQASRGKAGNRGEINGGTGDDVITVRGGNGGNGRPSGTGGKDNDGTVNTTPAGDYEAPGGSPGTNAPLPE